MRRLLATTATALVTKVSHHRQQKRKEKKATATKAPNLRRFVKGVQSNFTILQKSSLTCEVFKHLIQSVNLLCRSFSSSIVFIIFTDKKHITIQNYNCAQVWFELRYCAFCAFSVLRENFQVLIALHSGSFFNLYDLEIKP